METDISSIHNNFNQYIEDENIIVELTDQNLKLEKYYNFCKHEEVGAISSFIGTTKKFFNNNEVVKLEYECHPTMTIKQMRKICEDYLKKYKLNKVCLAHRLGVVPILEESLIIFTSSVSRTESIRACEEILEEVKKILTIWKKEYYKSEEQPYIWKENNTCIHYY